MPSLRDIAHVDGLCTFTNIPASAAAGLPGSHSLACRADGTGRQGRRHGHPITYKIIPAGSLSSSQPGGLSWWASQAGCRDGPARRAFVMDLPGGLPWWASQAGCRDEPVRRAAVMSQPGGLPWWASQAGFRDGPARRAFVMGQPGGLSWWASQAGCRIGPAL